MKKCNAFCLKQRVITDLIEWIDCNLSSHLNVSTVSNKSGYSRWYLQRCFFEVTGMTVAKYVRVRRLEYASRLLKSTQCSITDICFLVGYNDATVFSQAFKRHFGMPPCNYRKLQLRHSS